MKRIKKDSHHYRYVVHNSRAALILANSAPDAVNIRLSQWISSTLRGKQLINKPAKIIANQKSNRFRNRILLPPHINLIPPPVH